MPEKRFDEVRHYTGGELRQMRLLRLEAQVLVYREALSVLQGNIRVIRQMGNLSEDALIESLEFRD